MPQYFDQLAPRRPDQLGTARPDRVGVVIDAPDLRDSRDAIAWMAEELVGRLGFDRAMVLRPHRQLLAIARTAFRDQPEMAREAQGNAERNPVVLRPDGFEVEMMRRRCAALVLPVGDDRAWHPITDQLGMESYVAAPVRAFGRTFATLHADTYLRGRESDARDRATIEVFAQVCTAVVERALLFDEIHRLRAGARRHAEELLDLAGEELGDALDAPSPSGVPGSSMTASTITSPLTPRETEVLTLMSRGATSADIARQLVLSVGTVKTHARNILKKLGASTRAEAVARALGGANSVP